MKHSTHLAIPIYAESVEHLRAAALDAVDAGGTMLELRLDLCGDISDDDIRVALCDVPGAPLLLLTNRSQSEGGGAESDDESRLNRIERLAGLFHFIDIELSTWRCSKANRTLIHSALSQDGAAAEIATGRDVRRGLILSIHDFKGRPTSLQSDILACLEEPRCDVMKIAWHARNVRDCFEAFEWMRNAPKPVIAICMGEAGVPSRILAPKFGAFATFAGLRRDALTAPGQPTAADLLATFRWASIDAKSEVYGVIGHPVAHSLSPAAHNLVFGRTNRNAVYVPLDVIPGRESLKALLVEVEARPWLGIRGFSVTAPHKETALELAETLGFEPDTSSRRIGSLNTLALADSARAANTDLPAAMSALETRLGPMTGWRDGLRVLILGAGGAARAVLCGLRTRNIDVFVANRTMERAAALCGEIGGTPIPWETRDQQEFDVLINCTPIGQQPSVDESPWPSTSFPGRPVVFDTVYNPPRTRLIRDAEAAGCESVGGVEMFARQAARQYQVWTGLSADDEYRRAVNEVIRQIGPS